MANDALFLELSKALARPSGAYRAATEALNVPQQAIEGYKYGADFGDSLRKRKLEQQTLSDALGGQSLEQGIPNLTAETGTLQHPNIAAAIALEKVKNAGIPKPGRTLGLDQATKALSGVVRTPSKEDLAYLNSFPGGQIPESDFGKYFSARATQQNNIPKNEFFGTRSGQINLQQLPSELGPNTGAGAAYGVKIAARQGKALVANPGSAQRISLGSGDIARAVLRAAPQLDAQRGANFAENLATRWSSLAQKVTADPNGPDVPKIRKEMYDILDELDKSATPFIANHLQNYEDMLSPLSPDVKKRELGENLPDIPFNDGMSTGTGKIFANEQEAEASGYKGPATIGGRQAVVH